jgi:hypothetical protein
MNKTVTAITAILIIACFGLAVSAYTNWSQNINYTIATKTFTIDRTDLTLNYGVVESGTVKTETYIATNTGNIAINITASCTVSGASVSWNQATQQIVAGAQATYILTLTITGDGSATVFFNIT